MKQIQESKLPSTLDFRLSTPTFVRACFGLSTLDICLPTLFITLAAK